uniref:Reverse transcriptase zinc-binding domain-containing protein n=1 Tax=Arundo donax TaxID=35708 RepID=A0A0A9D5I2_ARUDO
MVTTLLDLMKHLHKFYNKMNIPWVQLIWSTHYVNGKITHATTEKGSFWWKDIMRLSDNFRGIASCVAGDGTTVLLWEDVWNNNYMKTALPRLFSFAKNNILPLAQFMSDSSIENNFHLPLTQQAMDEALLLQ